MKFLRTGSVSRARWAAIGAAIAVSLGVGGVAITHAVVDTGDKAVFVPISPCRLFDMRPAPDQVGPRGTALQPGETYTQSVRGANGNCNIPADATAVAMNVTAVGGTAGSFLTIWPSDVAPKPLASNLNWVPGSPPTPNKVDVKVSVADGKINLFNLTGTVSVLADVVGYYADHNHDDRYYTKGAIDTTLNSDVIVGQGLQFINNGGAGGPTHFTNQVQLPFGSGVQTQIVGPRTKDGITYGLREVTYCMNAASGAAFVNIVATYAAESGINHTDLTDRFAAGCYVLTVNDAVSASYNFYIAIGGGSGSVNVTSLTATWTPAALMPTSASAAGSGGTAGMAP